MRRQGHERQSKNHQADFRENHAGPIRKDHAADVHPGTSLEHQTGLAADGRATAGRGRGAVGDGPAPSGGADAPGRLRCQGFSPGNCQRSGGTASSYQLINTDKRQSARRAASRRSACQSAGNPGLQPGQGTGHQHADYSNKAAGCRNAFPAASGGRQSSQAVSPGPGESSYRQLATSTGLAAAWSTGRSRSRSGSAASTRGEVAAGNLARGGTSRGSCRRRTS